MHHEDRNVAHELDTEVAVGNAVQAVQGNAVKAKLCRLELTVCLIGRSRKCAASDRRNIHTLYGILQTVRIT